MNTKKTFTFYEKIILDWIDFEERDDVKEWTDFENIQNIYKIFKDEFLHPYTLQKAKGNEKKVFSEWLRGLPSCLNFDFYNYDILEAGKKAGFIFENDDQEFDFIEKYFDSLASAFYNLKDNL